MTLTMAELGGLGAGSIGRPRTWAEWHKAQTVQTPAWGTARRGESMIRGGEAAATTAWRRAWAAEYAAGVRGPARRAAGPRQFAREMSQRGVRTRRRSSRQDARGAWAARNAAARKKAAAVRVARSAARAKAQADRRARWKRQGKRVRKKNVRAQRPKPAPAKGSKAWWVKEYKQIQRTQPSTGDWRLELQRKTRAAFDARVRGGGPIASAGTYQLMGLSGLGALGG